MDVDKDGIISAEDVKAIYSLNGITISDNQANSMVKEAGAPLNFTVFLTLFGARLTGKEAEILPQGLPSFVPLFRLVF